MQQGVWQSEQAGTWGELTAGRAGHGGSDLGQMGQAET